MCTNCFSIGVRGVGVRMMMDEEACHPFRQLADQNFFVIMIQGAR